MAYEYEELILHDVKPLTNPGPPFRHEAMKELQEVYRKAKAWDNYLFSVKEDAKNEFGDNEDLVKHAVELNEKIFMGDE